MSAYVSLKGIQKYYGEVEALRHIDLEIPEGSFVTLLGPSGCGKSTLLRCIAGLETPTSGTIEVAGETLFDESKGLDLPTHRRNLSMVFQTYALWPHMTVEANVAYPLRAQKAPRAEAAERASEALKLLGLEEFHHRYPHQLSGGQQQRVAVARAIAYDSKLLLLDEPLSNLDQKLRDYARVELRRLQQRLGLTVIYVTHSQTEALTMSDRIAVMEGGVIHQYATPTELYEEPADEFVASFVGSANLLKGTWTSSGKNATTATFGGTEVRMDDGNEVTGESARAMIRPEDLRLLSSVSASKEPVSADSVVVPAVVAESEYLGSSLMYEVEALGTTLKVATTKRRDPDLIPGAKASLVFDRDDLRFLS